VGREKRGMDATRMVVEIDRRWDPTALYARIRSTGLPILGVKAKLVGCRQCILSFGEPLTSEAISMLQREILYFFKSDTPEVPQNGTGRTPKEQRRKLIKKEPYIRHRF